MLNNLNHHNRERWDFVPRRISLYSQFVVLYVQKNITYCENAACFVWDSGLILIANIWLSFLLRLSSLFIFTHFFLLSSSADMCRFSFEISSPTHDQEIHVGELITKCLLRHAKAVRLLPMSTKICSKISFFFDVEFHFFLSQTQAWPKLVKIWNEVRWRGRRVSKWMLSQSKVVV